MNTVVRRLAWPSAFFVAVLLTGCASEDDGAATGTDSAAAASAVKEVAEETATNVSAAAETVVKTAADKAESPAPAVSSETPAKTEVAEQPAKPAPAQTAPKVAATPQVEQTAPEKTAAPAPEEKAKPAPLSGPHKATVSFFEAMMGGNGDLAASLVSGSDAQLAAIKALSRFQKAGHGFKRKFIEAYGKEAWRTFNNPDHQPEAPTSARPPFNASMPLFEQRDLDQMKLYEPQISGDEAVYPSEQGEMRLLRSNGSWRLDASTVLPTGADDPAPAEQMMSQRAEVIEKFSAAVGAEGVSADDLDVELGRAFIEARFGMKIPEPHRFDISAYSN